MSQIFRSRDLRKNSLIYLSDETTPLRHWQTFKAKPDVKSRPLQLRWRYVTEIQAINRGVTA